MSWPAFIELASLLLVAIIHKQEAIISGDITVNLHSSGTLHWSFMIKSETAMLWAKSVHTYFVTLYWRRWNFYFIFTTKHFHHLYVRMNRKLFFQKYRTTKQRSFMKTKKKIFRCRGYTHTHTVYMYVFLCFKNKSECQIPHYQGGLTLSSINMRSMDQKAA